MEFLVKKCCLIFLFTSLMLSSNAGIFSWVKGKMHFMTLQPVIDYCKFTKTRWDYLSPVQKQALCIVSGMVGGAVFYKLLLRNKTCTGLKSGYQFIKLKPGMYKVD